MKNYALIMTFFLVFGINAAEVTWTGSGGDGDWFNAANWGGGQVPDVGDDVLILTGTGNPQLTNSVTVLSLTVSNKTLTFKGGDTTLTAGDVTVAGASGLITHTQNTDTNGLDGWQPDGRIRIICENLAVAAGSQINADYMGYRGGDTFGVTAPTNGCGPGGSIF